uniref:C2H2-type domain-containing protein n=1 Tax=Leersia perrieri TaxID=77586 RepID=A0A0D9WBI3_9ORYZ
MVEAGRAAASPFATMKTTTTKKKVLRKLDHKDNKKENNSKYRRDESQSQSNQCAAAAEPESPSYRLALKSLFSCRNSSSSHAHAHGHHRGCNSASSICKVKAGDHNPRPPRLMHKVNVKEEEPYCKRRASVSSCNSSSEQRSVKKPQKQQEAASSLLLSSSSSSGGSFRGMQQLSLRRLSGCYECHMVVDPISGSSSMRGATICSCPDCGEIFVRPESLHLHQAVRHAVSELGAEDTSRNIISIIFQSSWLKKQSPVCAIERILKVHNAARTLARFEEYRDAVKAKGMARRGRHPRCTADGNELLRFHCATLSCALGLHGATHLCDGGECGACGVIRDGFRAPAGGGGGIRTMATSGRAHDAVVADGERRAMLVCRVIAGRVRRQQHEEEEVASPAAAAEPEEEEYESVAGTAGLYSNLEELDVFNPRAILPCFVVIYRAT